MAKYKKYICFGYHDHYPSGGVGDIQYDTDNLEEAREFADTAAYDHREIIDRDTWEEVYTAT